ncbi:hypothetical protein JAAARDRAFT_178316 [Jaapia argillacea MUCL 33604]|uniref:E3 ubiquitin protein ligase n=1 Tax=Jaapia argillacea MUCL 33604 TaxID=933084 RepID=A0A067PVD7_9AGAM|nr:hypothetical protein JAAARDRAFT_178316 [Jaapia argillacea MUCL 33604]
MESRKRPLAEDTDPISTKKRAVASIDGSPAHVNGTITDEDEPKDNAHLELFRKEAIFRRMKHYSRECERSQSRIAQLEQRRAVCEAGLTAMQACWQQLVESMRVLGSPNTSPKVNTDSKDLFDMTVHFDPDSSVLRKKADATRHLLDSFVQLAEQKQPALFRDEMYQHYQRAQTECTALRSEMALLRSKIEDVESERDRYHDDLASVESRLERLQSRTVAELSGPNIPSPVKEEAARSPKKESEPSPAGVVEVNMETDRTGTEVRSPSSPVVSGHDNNRQSPGTSNDHGSNGVNGVGSRFEGKGAEDWADIAESRQTTIETLQMQLVEVNKLVNELKLDMQAPSDERIKTSAVYKVLLEQCSLLEHTTEENSTQIASLEKETNAWRAKFEEVMASIPEEVAVVKEGAAANAKRRETEVNRLRSQRDQIGAELVERKADYTAKLGSLQEYKKLAESCSGRVVVLQSEVKRLKSQLAANAGDPDLLAFCLSEKGEDVSYVEDLKSRLAAAECKASALEQSLPPSLSVDSDTARHFQSEVEARQQLIQVTKELDKYRSIYGESSSTLPPDVRRLSETLKQKETEVQKLRLQVSQHEQAETALYAELDKLSAAWESLDRQVKSKVFDLTAMEDRLTKIGVDKAKLENKFYAAMRDKEAIESERKNIARNLEKQAKVIEKLVESEKNLLSQIADSDKALQLMEVKFGKVDSLRRALEAQSFEYRHRYEDEKSRGTSVNARADERDRLLERDRSALRKQEEVLMKKLKDADREREKLKAREESLRQKSQSTQGYSKEAELQSEVDKCMVSGNNQFALHRACSRSLDQRILKCSTCGLHMRSTVITKCMHSFCKPCVDARIATRQRKCPACNLAFAQSDVQQLYFQ